MQRTTNFPRPEGHEADEKNVTAPRGPQPPTEAVQSPATSQPARKPHDASQSGSSARAQHGQPSRHRDGPTLIERIKEKSDILELARSLTSLRQSPSNKAEYFGKCPEPSHDDSRASFCVNSELRVYHCKGCGISGNAVGLYAMIHGMANEDAKFQLARQLGVLHEKRLDGAETMLSRAAGRYIWQLERKEDALKYLREERKLTDDTIRKFGLGYCWGTEFKELAAEHRKDALDTGLARLQDPNNPESTLRSFMAGRITFPVKNRAGNIVGYAGRLVPGGFASNGPKYLNSPETPWFHKSELLYGAHEATAGISRAGYALVVEGYMDVVGLHQAGVTNAVAVMGATANEATFENLWSLTRRLVFCLDGDQAGTIGALRSALAAGPTMVDGNEIAIARLPAGQDPDEFVLAHGEDAFRSLCERASPLARFLMEERSVGHDLSYPEGRARFIVDASEVAGIFANAPAVREQIIAEARAINAAALVHVALDMTGIAEELSPKDLRDAIALLQRRLTTLESRAEAGTVAAQARTPRP